MGTARIKQTATRTGCTPPLCCMPGWWLQLLAGRSSSAADDQVTIRRTALSMCPQLKVVSNHSSRRLQMESGVELKAVLCQVRSVPGAPRATGSAAVVARGLLPSARLMLLLFLNGRHGISTWGHKVLALPSRPAHETATVPGTSPRGPRGWGEPGSGGARLGALGSASRG